MKVLKAYLADFKRSFRFQTFVLVAYLIIICIIAVGRDEFVRLGAVVGIPILLSLISGAFHFASLPTMMYIVPYTKQMREEYIQKMLKVKLGVPMAVAVCMDIVMLVCDRTLFRAVVLQLVAVFFVSYLFGTLNDDQPLNAEYISAFGGLRQYNGSILMLCCLLSVGMYCACLSPISRVEFWIILIVVLTVFGTISLNIRKRWNTIRSNLASYEMVMTETEGEKRR
jgi:hypothetical protein